MHEWGDLTREHALIFDTETTGTGKQDVIVQFACILVRNDGTIQYTYNQLWKPPNDERMHPEAKHVHGISEEEIDARGREALEELKFVQTLFDACHKSGVKIVAHNSTFDVRMLLQTADSANAVRFTLCPDEVFCTQRNSRGRVPVYDKLGRFKAPSNSELYVHFNHSPPQEVLHDALNDCKVTASNYLQGRKAEWWQ